MKYAFAVSALIFSVNAAEGSEQLKVRQVSSDTYRVAAERTVSDEVAAGDEYIATFDGGKQCVLKVTSVQSSIVTLNSRGCGQRDLIRSGMTLERSLLTPEAPPVEEKTSISSSPLLIQLTDLSFLPRAGTSFVDISIGRSSTNETVSQGSSTNVASTSTATSAQMLLAHGITSDLSIGIQVEQTISDQSNYTYGPASSLNGTRTTTTDIGLYDPILGLEYRALRQGADPINAFIGLTIQPSVFDAKSATATSNGTNGAGGHSAVISGRLVYESAHIGAQISSAFMFRDKRTRTDATTGAATETTGGDTLNISGVLQAKLSSLFALNFGVGWSALGALESKTGTNPNTVVSAFSYTKFGIGARATLVPDRFMLMLDIEATGGANSKAKSNGIEYDDALSQNTLKLGGRFAF